MTEGRSVNVRFLRNGALVRALLSSGLAFSAEWSFTVAISLVAYADGGTLAVGLVGLVRLLPAALLAPVIAAYADRMPRERVLILSCVVRALATLAMAPVLWAGGHVHVVYALAVASTMAFTPYRSTHSALMPSLCRTPDELTSVNVVRGFMDSLSVIVGPLSAALFVAVFDVASVFLFAGVCALLAGALVLRLDYARLAPAPRRRLLVEIKEGMAAVRSYDGVRMVVGFVVLQMLLRGAFTVFVVVIALELLGRDEGSVGVLQSAVGFGALLGSAACVLLVGSRAMARWLGFAVVLWGVPMALIGALPSYAVALLAAGVIGVGNSLVDVTAFTLIARMVPNALLARVFGVLESVGALAVGLASVATPLLISLLGLRGALVAVGAIAPVAFVLWWRQLTMTDRSVAVRTDDILLLRRIAMLRSLPVPVLEQLAHGLDPVELGPGEILFEAGDNGDSFYVVRSGVVRVLDHDRVVRSMGAGEGFGEIALLGQVARTMTVRAEGPVRLYGIRCTVFLPAVTSISEARSAAEATRQTYLAQAPGLPEAASDDL